MKSLITIFAHCPDDHRKKVLYDLLSKLQPKRPDFDILVVSHSEISQSCFSLIDFFYYDSDNRLLQDFDLRKKHWFRNKGFIIHSVLVYPPSTHLAIYRLLYYTFSFAKFHKYEKVHCLEYDINLSNQNLINDVDKKLDEFDTVMFKRNDNWIYGTYFAFTMKKFPDDYFIYNEKEILDRLRKAVTRMTEEVTHNILTPNDRTILFEPISILDSEGIFQKVDNHSNNELQFCVPVCDKNSDTMYFFVWNEGFNASIDVLVNDKHMHIESNNEGIWDLRHLGNIEEINSIIVLVNGKIKKEIFLTPENRKAFKEDNFIDFLNNE